MNRIVLLLACVAYVGDGRRVGSAFNPTATAQASSRPASLDSQTRLGHSGPQMYKMPKTLKALRNRMASLESVATITYTMKFVAAAKVRRAQQAVLRSRPYNQGLERILGGLLQEAKTEDVFVPLLEDRECKTAALIVIMSDRGLCGPYNNRMKRAANRRIGELKALGVGVKIFVVGDKGNSYFRYESQVTKEEDLIQNFEMGKVPSAGQAGNISAQVLSGFFAGDYDRVELIYTEFINMADQFPALRTLIPLLPSGMEIPEDEIFRLTTSMSKLVVGKEGVPVAKPADFSGGRVTFNDDIISGVNAILPLYFNGQLLRTLQEAVASELALRMQAMDKATTNAKKMKKKTTLRMHKVRRGRINFRLAEATLIGEIMKKQEAEEDR